MGKPCEGRLVPRSWEPGFMDYLANLIPTKRVASEVSGTVPLLACPIDLLDANCLGGVLAFLPPRELAKCQLVCKSWRAVARASSVIRRAFINTWGLASLEGSPRSWAVAEYATLQSFVHRHVVRRSDTLTAIAVKYSRDVGQLKRLNNMTTDHSLHSRTHIYIPVNSAAEVAGQDAQFVFCHIAGREFILLPDQNQDAPPPTSNPQSNKAHTDKLAKLLGRSLKVDDLTAHFYLDEAEGDVKKAMKMAQLDANWERSGEAMRHHGRHTHSHNHQHMGLGRSLINALRGR